MQHPLRCYLPSILFYIHPSTLLQPSFLFFQISPTLFFIIYHFNFKVFIYIWCFFSSYNCFSILYIWFSWFILRLIWFNCSFQLRLIHNQGNFFSYVCVIILSHHIVFVQIFVLMYLIFFVYHMKFLCLIIDSYWKFL